MAQVTCPRCNTGVEKPAQGMPVCPNCGFGKKAGPPVAKPKMSVVAPPPPPGSPPGRAKVRGMGTTTWTEAPRARPLPPPQPYRASTADRPALVTASAVLQFIGGAFTIVLAALVLVGTAAMALIFPPLAAFFILFGLFLLALGAFSILLGVMLLKGKFWAHLTTVVLAGFGILLAFVLVVLGEPEHLVYLVFFGFIVVALMMPRSWAWFQAMHRQEQRSVQSR